MTIARITVLLNLDDSKAGAGDMIDAQEQTEFAIANHLEIWFGNDQRFTAWRVIGDWPETPDIFEMSDPLGAP